MGHTLQLDLGLLQPSATARTLSTEARKGSSLGVACADDRRSFMRTSQTHFHTTEHRNSASAFITLICFALKQAASGRLSILAVMVATLSAGDGIMNCTAGFQVPKGYVVRQQGLQVLQLDSLMKEVDDIGVIKMDIEVRLLSL